METLPMCCISQVQIIPVLDNYSWVTFLSFKWKSLLTNILFLFPYFYNYGLTCTSQAVQVQRKVEYTRLFLSQWQQNIFIFHD